MINSFITNEKEKETHSKIHNINCVCGLDENKNHENNKEHYLYKIRQNFYNNHVFYSNNKFEKIPNFTETIDNLNQISRYNSNSKNKKEQEKMRQQELFNNKINHRNKYQNINNACHSYENKKENNYNNKNNKRILKVNDFKKNNIKLNNEEMNTPKINNKKGIKTNNNINKENERNNNDDLSKTLENFKKRKNYGYKEIKYIKNNENKYQIINKNNNKKLNNNYNKNQKEISDYIINNQITQDNYDFRNSLKLINKKMSNNFFPNNDDKNYNISYKVHLTKPNITNNSKNTIQETQKNLNQLKKNVFIKNNCSSYRNINDYPKIKEKENYENRNLLIKQYTTNTPENKNKNQKQSLVNYTNINKNKINNNNYMNSIDTDKDNINTSRYISSELKEGSTDIKTITNKHHDHHDNIYLKNIIYPRYMKNKQNKGNITTIKEDFSKVFNIFNHEKQKSFSNNIINTENIYSSKDEKNNINSNIKSGINIKQLLPNKNINYKEKYIKKQDNSNDKHFHKIPPNLNNISKKNDKSNYINNSREKMKKNNFSYYNYKNNEDNNINISTRIKTEYKEPHKKLSTNNCETKKYYYNNRFKINNLNKEDTKTKSKEKGKAKEIVRKQYKSLEKKGSTEKIKIKKNLFTKNNNHNRTKTKSKSKSKARKHSKCIKYLDNLKIFKFSETGYNINNNDSSTANTRNNNEEKKYRKYILKTKRNESKKKKNINSFNLQYKTYEEDFRLKNIKIKEICKYLKPQISCRITLSKKNNVNIVGLLRYFKVNYFCSENLRCEYDSDSEDTSEYYNNKF